MHRFRRGLVMVSKDSRQCFDHMDIRRVVTALQSRHLPWLVGEGFARELCHLKLTWTGHQISISVKGRNRGVDIIGGDGDDQEMNHTVLSHLCWVDDIWLFAPNTCTLQTMIDDLTHRLHHDLGMYRKPQSLRIMCAAHVPRKDRNVVTARALVSQKRVQQHTAEQSFQLCRYSSILQGVERRSR